MALTGLYKEMLIIFSIIIIHEFGHFIMAHIFKWNIKEIRIYPFGGCVKFDERINRPIKEEVLILLFGPFIQILYSIVIIILFKRGIISLRNYNLFMMYHISFLIFNLLPIYPLDGGRLLNLLFNYKVPFILGNKIVILISFIILSIVSILINNISFYFMTLVLVIEILTYYKNQNNIYNRFLLERYLYKYRFKHFKVIKSSSLMYKERRNVIKNKDKFITEDEYLKKRFGI